MSKTAEAPAPSAANSDLESAIELQATLRRHKELYYNEQPEISDAEYDALEEQLRALVEANPSIADEITVLDQVGAAASNLFSDVRHAAPMLSLDKVHDDPALAKFLAKFEDARFALWPKFDGASLSVRYENGKLVQAATRGDGRVGDDITANVAEIKNLPSKLDSAIDCEVRGEVVMLKSDFATYNAAHPEKPLVNTRNAAAGTLRAKTRSKVADRPLTFYPFDLVGSEATEGKTLADELTGLGFHVEGYTEVSSVDEVNNYVAELESKRDSLDYDVDGVVIKLADRAAYEAAGSTSHHPRGAVARKLAAEIGETELLEVIWQVGKSGINAPVADINPVFVAGTTIRRASLHNLAMIAERDIRIGDRIQIKRAGDVIPHVIGPVDTSKRSGSETSIERPTSCASCAGPLVEEGESRILRCENVQGCPAQLLRRLIHWAGRSAADIDAVGEKWIAKLVEAGLLSKPSDFYALDSEQLIAAFDGDGMGKRLAEKMVASIETSKSVGLRRTIIGWSIPFASEGTAVRLCRAGYESIEQVAAATVAELEQIEDVGPVVAESLNTFLNLPATQAEITALRAKGVSLDVAAEDVPVEVAADAAFTDKKVVITGTLSVGRNDFKKVLEAAGAKVSSSISKNTDYLVAGESAGSKLTKAEDLGVAVLTEAEARAMIES